MKQYICCGVIAFAMFPVDAGCSLCQDVQPQVDLVPMRSCWRNSSAQRSTHLYLQGRSVPTGEGGKFNQLVISLLSTQLRGIAENPSRMPCFSIAHLFLFMRCNIVPWEDHLARPSRWCRPQKKTCPLGDACSYAHNVFEHWLHPSR